MGCVYKITNLINQKVYIGYTTRTMEERWKQHISCAYNPNTKDGSYEHALKRAIRKYGVSNFSIEQLESSDNKEYLSEREKYWIQYYNSCTMSPNGYGYNLTFGGDGGNGLYKPIYRIDISTGTIEKEFTSETEAIKEDYNTSIANVVNHPYKPLTANGKTYMEKSIVDTMTHDELIDYLYNRYNFICQYDSNGKLIAYYPSIDDAAAQTGIGKATIINALCNARKHGGKYQWCYYKNKESKEHHRIFNFNGEKAVLQLDKDNNLIGRYTSIKEAAQKTQCDASGITKVCKGKRKMCGGFQWRYDTE